MASLYSQVQTLMDAAVTAIGSGDYTTALNKAVAAQVILAIVPDMVRNPSGGGGQTMTWTRQTVNDLIVNLRRQQSAALGVQVVDNTYYGEMGVP